MGILSFLQKKSGDKSKSAVPQQGVPYRDGGLPASLKSQAYDSAVPGALPVIGAYPVAGNGPNVLETLSRSASRLNETQLSLDGLSMVDRSAPSPAIPRFREDGLERPSTAPHGTQPTNNWASVPSRFRQNSLRGSHPPVSFRKARNDSSNSSSFIPEIGTAVLAEPPAVPPGAPFTHARTNSIRSDVERSFKDILDAQAEIKPGDFKSRVQATGARDYGEDVADRNIGENGVDLESPQVQAFYAMSNNGSVRGRPSQIITSCPWRRDDSLSRPESKQSLYETSSVRTKSLNSTAHYTFPKRTTSHTPRPPAESPAQSSAPQGSHMPVESQPAVDVRLPSTAKSIRRQSLHTYMPTGSTGTNSNARGRLAFSQRGMDTKDIPHYVATTGEADTSSWTAPSPDLSNASSGSPRIGTGFMPRQTSGLRPQSPKPPRDSMVLPRRKAKAPPSNNYMVDDGQSEPYTPSNMSFSHHRPSSYSQRGSVISFASQRQSGHTFHSSISSSIASHDTAVDFTPLAYPKNRSRTVREEHPHAHGRLAGVDAVDRQVSAGAKADASMQSAKIKVRDKAHHRGDHDRSYSMTSTIGKGRYDEPHDLVPARTNSLRHWSISSTSLSNASSNSLAHSRYTADTSLDLGNAFSVKSSSRTSLNTTIANSPLTAKASTFNIDDYISSDDDDYTTPRPRGEGEEDLLFSESGYGVDGSFLPGLCTGLSSPAFHSHKPSSVSPKQSPALRNSYSSTLYQDESLSPRPSRAGRYVLDTAADSDSDFEDSADENWYDAKERRFSHDVSPRRNARGTKRLSAIGTLYGHQYYVSDVIEEERLEQVDIAAAVKLRKEVKTRKREAQMAKRKLRMQGKQAARELEARAWETDGASNADVEC